MRRSRPKRFSVVDEQKQQRADILYARAEGLQKAACAVLADSTCGSETQIAAAMQLLMEVRETRNSAHALSINTKKRGTRRGQKP